MNKIIDIKRWSVPVTMTVIPLAIIFIYGAIILGDVYFSDAETVTAYQFSRCIFKLNCSHSEMGIYAVYAGMIFAVSWVVAYAFHYEFPKNLKLLLLGTVIAAPMYAFGISGMEKALQSNDIFKDDISLLTYCVMGVLGAAFHTFGAAVMIRLSKGYLRLLRKQKQEG